MYEWIFYLNLGWLHKKKCNIQTWFFCVSISFSIYDILLHSKTPTNIHSIQFFLRTYFFKNMTSSLGQKNNYYARTSHDDAFHNVQKIWTYILFSSCRFFFLFYKPQICIDEKFEGKICNYQSLESTSQNRLPNEGHHMLI